MKQLIITGDDFGLNHRVNESIERYHRAGLLTQASLMVNGPSLDEAVEIARRNPRLCVGLHLDVLGAHPPALAGLSYAFSPRARRRAIAEIAAQFERFVSLGFSPTYWDGHTHLHLHPFIFSASIPLAVRLKFRATRLIRGEQSSAVLARIFRALSAHAERKLRGSSIHVADRVFGLRRTGRITTDWFAAALESLPQGLTEIYFHPGAEPAELDTDCLLRVIEREKIQLVNQSQSAD